MICQNSLCDQRWLFHALAMIFMSSNNDTGTRVDGANQQRLGELELQTQPQTGNVSGMSAR